MRHTLTALACLFAATAPAAEASKPNVVVILADDMGIGDLGCYNPKGKIATPHLDRLAAGGMRFTDAHTPSSVCTPTRYGLLTGRYCWRTRLTSGVLDGFSPPLIENDRTTVASFLKQQGYDTACIGKWHLGMQWTRLDGKLEDQDRGTERGFRPGTTIDFGKPVTAGPLTVGFDSYFGISASLDMSPLAWIEQDRSSPAPDMTVPGDHDTLYLVHSAGAAHSDFKMDVVLGTLKRRSVEWLHARKDSDKPFFLYLPLNSPHLPVAPSAAFIGKSGIGLYGDFVMETDDCVGGVLDALKNAGKLDNTLVIFTADNGGLWHEWTPQEADDVKGYKPTPRGKVNGDQGHHSNAHLRGTKADVWEGGHRVPFIAHWPAKVAGGQVSGALVELTDILATCADVLGERLPAGAGPDSHSFFPALKDASSPGRDFAVHHTLAGKFSIRMGGWKLAEERGSGGFSTPRTVRVAEGEAKGQLYDLANDPSETKNLYLEHPDIVARLQKKLDEVRAEER